MRFVCLYFAKHQLFPYLIRLRVASLHLYKAIPFSIHSLIGLGYTWPTGSGCSRPSCLANVPIALCWAAMQRGHPSASTNWAGMVSVVRTSWLGRDDTDQPHLRGPGWYRSTPTLLFLVYFGFVLELELCFFLSSFIFRYFPIYEFWIFFAYILKSYCIFSTKLLIRLGFSLLMDNRLIGA